MDPNILISDQALFAIALLTGVVGALYDLKTTEIPDYVPFFGFLAALIVYIARGIAGYGWGDVFIALSTAVIFLAFGYVLFYLGQWGEADVLLLAAMGFAVPKPLSFFNPNLTQVREIWFYPLAFLLNSFVIGAAYSIAFAVVYALVFGEERKKLLLKCFEGMKVKTAISSIPLLMGTAAYFVIRKYDISLAGSMFVESCKYSAMMFAIFLLFNFAKYVDREVFMRYIPVENLREGDVLAEDIVAGRRKFSSKLFVGLTKKDVDTIKRAWKAGRLKSARENMIRIKEGVRYAPTFPLTLLFTAKYGFILFHLL